MTRIEVAFKSYFQDTLALGDVSYLSGVHDFAVITCSCQNLEGPALVLPFTDNRIIPHDFSLRRMGTMPITDVGS